MIEETISHYRLLSKLGAGGMGEVYLAKDVHLDRDVAIKFPSSLSLDETDRARFLREARLASAFHHPNIATIFDFGETADHRPFLVMELVRGRSLQDLIAHHELNLSQSIDICLDVSRALTEAHSHGILHRDIKPSNIVVNSRGATKVLDFGLAKQFRLDGLDLSGAPTFSEQSSLTSHGVIVGTPQYMSPEQVAGKELDSRSDLFSLGVTLYQCLTGVRPFKGGTLVEICSQILHADPEQPSKLNPRITPDIERVILKTLKKEPAERYQSVLDFTRDLTAASASLSSEETRKLGSADAAAQDNGVETEHLKAAGSEELRGDPARGVLGRLKSGRAKAAVGIASVGVVGAISIVLMYWTVRPTNPGPEAVRLFERGVEALQNGSYLAATNSLNEAVKSEDNWPLAHARLAEAWYDVDNVEMAGRTITAAHARAQNGPQLTAEDELYLKAVTSTVDLKHDDAVKALEEIEKLRPDHPYVAFDIARALERASKSDQAIAKLEKMLSMNSRSPAAYLRLGILYARKGDVTHANVCFDRAREIYQAQQSSEGVTEVSLQRGVMNIGAKNYVEAQGELEAALRQARSQVPNVFQEIRALLQLSVLDTRTSRLESAEKLANEAFATAETSGFDYMATGGRVVIGDVLFRKNQFATGEEFTLKGLQMAERYRVPRWIAVAAFNLGSIRIQQRRSTEGLELVKKSKPFFDKSGRLAQSREAQGLIGRAQRDLGAYQEARQTLEGLLREVEKDDDKNSQANVLLELGHLDMVLEDFAGARKYYEQAANLYRARGEKVNLVLTLSVLAEGESLLGLDREARRDLAEALTLATEPSMRFDMLNQEARIALVSRSFEAAVRKSSEALKGIDQTDPSTMTGAKLQLSAGLLGLQRLRESVIASRKAIESAKACEGQRWLARARLGLAEALMGQPENEAGYTEARSLAIEANNEFSRGGQRESQWRALLVASSASARLGDLEGSRAYARQASALLGELAAEPGYESYRSRPDVKFRRRQLDMLLDDKKPTKR